VGGPNADTVSGGDGDDTLYASPSSGSVNGELHGDAGADVLHGVSGGNILDGGAGTDTLYDGTGNDCLIGGSGADSFVFGAAWGDLDAILDFQDGAGTEDVIAIDRDAFASFDELQAAMSQSFTYVRITLDADNTLLIRDTTVDQLGPYDFVFI
jgi:Ca2+-binding RTX toxin-like protein